jgi:hypothetical protein
MFPPFAAVSILTYRATVSRKLNIRAQKNQVELSWLLYSFLKNPIPIIGLYTIVKDTSGSLIFENVVYSLVRTLESKMKKKKKITSVV